MKSVKNLKKTLVFCMVFLFLFSFTVPSLYSSSCAEALGKCMVDAVATGVFGGIPAGVAYALGCGTGYSFCVRYS